MANSAPIQGMQRSGPDRDREVHESPHVEQVDRAVRQGRHPEPNDPIVTEAISSLKEVANMDGRKLDLEYETNTGLIVMTLYAEDGEEIIRQIPPEEAIRMAQNRKEMKSRYLDEMF